jgi:hypothetical protein
LILYPGTSTTYPNSLGIESNYSLWISSPNSIKFYNKGINSLFTDSSGNTSRNGNIYITGKVGIGTNNPYTSLHIKGVSPKLTIAGNGGSGATTQLDLSTYDTTTNLGNCSLIAIDDGSYGATFQIRQKKLVQIQIHNLHHYLYLQMEMFLVLVHELQMIL